MGLVEARCDNCAADLGSMMLLIVEAKGREQPDQTNRRESIEILSHSQQEEEKHRMSVS